jgi:hypothetical protein
MAKVSEGASALVEDSAEPRAQSVIVNDEDLTEVGHLQDWTHHEGSLEHLKSH